MFAAGFLQPATDPGGLRHNFCHVSDLTPTLLETLGIDINADMEGTSFAGTVADPTFAPGKHTQYFEMFGHRGIWHDGFDTARLLSVVESPKQYQQ